MKAFTLAVFALFCASLVWAQGGINATQGITHEQELEAATDIAMACEARGWQGGFTWKGVEISCADLLDSIRDLTLPLATPVETDNAVIYRMTTDDWQTCNALHGAVEHDAKGWYCAVEKHNPDDAGGGDGLTLLSTGNVDRLHYSEVQVMNPDPAGAPLTVPIIGVELHFMDMGPGFWPIDLRIYFPLMPNNARNVENCVEWFGKTQNRELALNINHEPGNWDGTKSPWPYFQVAINPNTKQIHTWTVDGAEIWLWDANDVQCWLAYDNLGPYWQNPDGVRPREIKNEGRGTLADLEQGRSGALAGAGDPQISANAINSSPLRNERPSELSPLLANPKWHVLVAWDGKYRAARNSQ